MMGHLALLVKLVAAVKWVCQGCLETRVLLDQRYVTNISHTHGHAFACWKLVRMYPGCVCMCVCVCVFVCLPLGISVQGKSKVRLSSLLLI